jgi:hypothetical protein
MSGELAVWTTLFLLGAYHGTNPGMGWLLRLALLVYWKFGLAMLRRSWFNLDLIWAIALAITGAVALLV